MTHLAVEYKDAYSNPEWVKIRYQSLKQFEDWNKDYIREIRYAKTRIFVIIKTISRLRQIVTKAKPILLSASWVSFKIKIAITIIDIIQNAIWRFV
ncbi:hypothetical protein [Mycoplasma sp. 'Moose RK']|uniref:hypothetical protein n=1 Tax=Mycoplasma sp. 'Moose RK' TaxID=2780095 RepID=UPI001E600177|nr:hypothetical protein [Mycoplasma sp. 'Moose RK']